MRNICNIQEAHLKSKADLETNNNTIFMFGAEAAGRNGVNVIIDRRISESLTSHETKSDRIMKPTLESKPAKCQMFNYKIKQIEYDNHIHMYIGKYRLGIMNNRREYLTNFMISND